MEKVFVTGSNGLLGTNLIAELLGRGYAVKGLVRNPSSYKGVQHPKLELVKGGILDDLSGYMQDCHAVVHAAALTSQHLAQYAPYQKVNVEGTLNVFQSAELSKVEKFVFVSTANTIGYGGKSGGGTEEAPIRYPFSKSFYALSKLEAESKLMGKSQKIPIVIVNPTFMIGPYDTKPSSGRIILMGLNRKILFYPPGGKNFVHVKDVATGVVNCLTQGKAGEKYLLAGENLTYRDFFRKLFPYSPNTPFMVRIPPYLLQLMGSLGDILRKLNINTSISSVNMKALCVNNFYSRQKSESRLTLRYQSVDRAIAQAIAYFRENSAGKV